MLEKELEEKSRDVGFDLDSDHGTCGRYFDFGNLWSHETIKVVHGGRSAVCDFFRTELFFSMGEVGTEEKGCDTADLQVVFCETNTFSFGCINLIRDSSITGTKAHIPVSVWHCCGTIFGL